MLIPSYRIQTKNPLVFTKTKKNFFIKFNFLFIFPQYQIFYIFYLGQSTFDIALTAMFIEEGTVLKYISIGKEPKHLQI